MELKVFAGKGSDNIKPWAKQLRNYCNFHKPGFRAALEWSESQTDAIRAEHFSQMGWLPAAEANIDLYEFLLTVVSDEALVLVENYPDAGFEAWRQLIKRYNPTGRPL